MRQFLSALRLQIKCVPSARFAFLPSQQKFILDPGRHPGDAMIGEEALNSLLSNFTTCHALFTMMFSMCWEVLSNNYSLSTGVMKCR